MPISQIIAIIKDVVLGGLAIFAIYQIYHAGQNQVRVADVQALQQQLVANAAQEQKWQQEFTDAEAQRKSDMANVSASIGAQHAPVIVRIPADSSSVPSPTTGPGDHHPAPGSADNGPGVSIDIRQAVNDFELKYEDALSQCRALKQEWPK